MAVATHFVTYGVPTRAKTGACARANTRPVPARVWLYSLVFRFLRARTTRARVCLPDA